MLEVKIENIIPVTEARDRFNQIVDTVEGTDEMFVMTKNGKPAAIMVGVHHMEKLTGESHKEVFGADEAQNPPQSDSSSPAVNAPEPTNNFAPPQPPVSTQPEPIATPEVVEPVQAPVPSFDAANNLDSPAPSAPPVSDQTTEVPAEGQALAPDAVTPAQTTGSDPFALPNEPLDLPEDEDLQNQTAQQPVDTSAPAAAPAAQTTDPLAAQPAQSPNDQSAIPPAPQI